MIHNYKSFLENNNSPVTVGPVEVESVDESGDMVEIKASNDTFLLDPNKDTGIKSIPKEGYNYVFEVEGDLITKVIFYVTDLVVISEDKVLLIKRKNDPFKNQWSLPGGFIDVGETPEEAAIRELEEETSLELDQSDITFVGKYDDEYRDPRNKYVVSFSFKAELKSTSSVIAKDDALEAEWIDIKEALKLDLAFDHKDIIKKAIG